MKPTSEERTALRLLGQLERCWPDSLWLFAANGSLCVMRKDDGKRRTLETGNVDSTAVVTTICIEADGGDW